MEVGVVYVTHYSGDKMPPLYIGSSTEARVSNGYHGTVTSKRYGAIWKTELTVNPHLFQTIIISRHASRREAMLEEARLQKQLDVVRGDLFINMAIANANGFYGPSQRGVKKSSEHIRKIASALTGRVVTEQARRNNSLGQLNKKSTSDAARANMSLAQSGSNNARTLTFIVTSPDGTQYVVDGGLRKFCRLHGLSMSKMFRYIGTGVIPSMDNKQQPLAKACTGWKVDRT